MDHYIKKIIAAGRGIRASEVCHRHRVEGLRQYRRADDKSRHFGTFHFFGSGSFFFILNFAKQRHTGMSEGFMSCQDALEVFVTNFLAKIAQVFSNDLAYF